MKIVLIAALSLLLGSVAAHAQNPVLQSGTVTKGHAAKWSAQGTIQDAGPWSGGGPNVGISDLPIVGTGTPLCIYDAPATNSLGYHSLCLGANDSSKGQIRFDSSAAATQIPLQLCMNGQCYDFPFTGSGSTGPNPSTMGSLAFFDNTTGTLLGENRLSVSGYYYPPTVGQALKSTTPSQDPAALLALEKTFDTGGLPNGAPIPRPTLFSACKLAAVGTDTQNMSCRGGQFEGIDNVGGFGTFVEGVKGVAIGTFTSGIGGGVYGGIMWGQSYNSQYTIGVEAQTARTAGGDAPGPRGFNKDRFIAGFMHSNGLGSVGDRADVGFLINPYNPKKTSAGFMCSKGTIETTAGICFADWGGSAFGLDLSLGGPSPHTVGAILISNQDPILFFKTDNNIGVGMYMGTDNVIHIGGVIGQQVIADGPFAVAGSLTANSNVTIYNNANVFSAANYEIRGVASPTLQPGVWTIWTDSTTAELKATFGSSPYTVKVLAP